MEKKWIGAGYGLEGLEGVEGVECVLKGWRAGYGLVKGWIRCG